MREQKCLFSHEADDKAEYSLVEASNTRPPILTKDLRAAKRQKNIQTVVALKKADASDAMESDSGDEDLQNFLNNQYFMMQQMLPTPASPIDVTNDSPIQGCAPPAGSHLVCFEADRSSDSEDSDSDSTCSDHSSCQIPGGCNPDKIDKSTGLCPLHAPHDCGSTRVVKLSDMNAMVPSGVARGLVTLLSTDLHE